MSQQSNKRWGSASAPTPVAADLSTQNVEPALHTATLTGVEKTDNVCEGRTFRSTCWLGGHQQQDETMLQPPSCSTHEASR